jgi:hypothetical protein
MHGGFRRGTESLNKNGKVQNQRPNRFHSSKLITTLLTRGHSLK